jgi:ABC-type uncharacterized transport system permease subunit
MGIVGVALLALIALAIEIKLDHKRHMVLVVVGLVIFCIAYGWALSQKLSGK